MVPISRTQGKGPSSRTKRRECGRIDTLNAKQNKKGKILEKGRTGYSLRDQIEPLKKALFIGFRKQKREQ